MDLRTLISPVLALALIGTTNAFALELDSSQSTVKLVSTKVLADGASSAAEIFTFDSLTGNVGDDGAATVMIDLGAVQTGIDIRNERMAEYLFETADYPEAIISATIDDAIVTAGVHKVDLDIDVDLHGSKMSYTVPVVVSADDSSVTVISEEPLLLDAASFDLQGGLGKLSELAGLLHIPATVPVTFSLSFTR